MHNCRLVSEILGKNQKLLTLIICDTEVPLYTKKYIPLRISHCTGQIRCVVDNKVQHNRSTRTMQTSTKASNNK